jgi:hypothetical protein
MGLKFRNNFLNKSVLCLGTVKKCWNSSLVFTCLKWGLWQYERYSGQYWPTIVKQSAIEELDGKLKIKWQRRKRRLIPLSGVQMAAFKNYAKR